MTETTKVYTACLIIIGNEILSGRTRDANLQYLAEKLNEWGVRLTEARVIPDVDKTIVDTLNHCRAAFDYVFTTGGIGPTHDDITAAAVAKAFGVGLVLDRKSYDAMASRYANPADFNEARQKMCYIPDGATVIENAVSIAPGFQIGNVFVMAGVPSIMRAMVDSLQNRLVGGAPVVSRAVAVFLGEGAVAQQLAAIQDGHPEIDIGSYPFYRDGKFGTSLVLRGTDMDELETALEEVVAMIRGLGTEPVYETT
jgi:molybdenum cofactor synthesis domain-containing protein